MAMALRALIKGILAALAVTVIFVAWEVEAVRLPIASWILWTALCWRSSPDDRS